MPIKDFISTIKEIFELKESDKSVFNNLSEELIHEQLKYLRNNLEISAKKCNIYGYITNHFGEEITSLIQESHADYVTEKWLSIIDVHRSIYDMIGYLTLLQMDAMTTCISLFGAKTDTERVMLCKHAYTILYETLEHNLFKKVSCDMRKYPEELITSDELNGLWENVKISLKDISEKKEAQRIRNSIDAHKSNSFMHQIDAYKTCKWAQSIINLYVLIQIIDKIQNCMEGINQNMNELLEAFKIETKEYIKELDYIRKSLQQFDETFLS